MVTKRKGPPRLGKPEPGIARFFTTGETEATGLTRSCLIFVDYTDEAHILLNNKGGFKEVLEDHDWIVQQLEKFWGSNESK